MSHIPPPEDPHPPSSSPTSSPERQVRSTAPDAERKPVRPPPMLTLLAFLVGFGLIIAFVVSRYILPGHTDY